jgi:hypothetical protein
MKQITARRGAWVAVSLLAATVCLVADRVWAAEKGMSLGTDSIHASDDTCFMLGAKAEAGDFFSGLRSHGKQSARMFRKNGKIVTLFPSSLMIDIAAGFDSCTAKSRYACDRCDFHFNSEFMSSLQFEAYWKHGFELRKATVEIRTVYESDDLAKLEPSARLWRYELSVKAENVPLTDALVLVVLDSTGRTVSRLSGRL